MGRASPLSVTDVPCKCGYLQTCAADPNLPVKFDSQVNEFFFESVLAQGTRIAVSIYHCPMCGGVASDSIRDTLFKTIPEDEVRRLDAKLANLRNIQDVIAALGPPDEERSDPVPADTVIYQPVSGERETGVIRQLTYKRLSETADVYFSIYSNGEMRSSISAKYIGPQSR